MTDRLSERLDSVLRDAETLGTWAEYAVFSLGDTDTGFPDLDKAIEMLYHANEDVHRIANKLALRYDVAMFQERVDE